MIPLPYVDVVLHAGLLIWTGLCGYVFMDLAIHQWKERVRARYLRELMGDDDV